MYCRKLVGFQAAVGVNGEPVFDIEIEWRNIRLTIAFAIHRMVNYPSVQLVELCFDGAQQRSAFAHTLQGMI